MMRVWRLVVCGMSLAFMLQGQEVRRALPVAPTPSPGTAPRAQPVLPEENSILNERLPSAEEAARPRKVEPDARSSKGSAAEPDSKPQDQTQDEIRLAPGQKESAEGGSDPAKAQLAIADGLYIRKMYDLAVPEYEKYLGQFANDSGRASAMYRLADSYSHLGQELPALNTYRMLINSGSGGEFVGSAAFRLASRAFDEKDYPDAASLYEKAYDNAKSPEVKLTARYYQAKCLELSNQKSGAKTAYEDVAKTKDKNPYRDAARLSLAYFALENNQKQQALDLFEDLGNSALKTQVRAEALTRAGILAADLKQKDKADQLFKTAIALNAEGKWKQVAQLEQMKLQYEGDKFSQVLDSFAKNVNSLNDETKPSVLLLVANSYRQLSKHQKALEIYNQLIRQYSNTPEAYDARYQRLVSLDAIKDPTLINEVDTYLATGPARDRADKAKLLKAQALVQQNRFEPAARLYHELTNSSLPDQYKADCYYAEGYALVQIKDSQGAIKAFSGLIDRFPKHPMAPKALFKRATLYQDSKNFSAAVADFGKIISNYPACAERETAMLQKGLTLGQQAAYPEMAATFRQLLKEYPNGAGAPQAYYWIGWSAFEAKHFADAIDPLIKARELNPAEYTQRVSLRLMLCYQHLNKKAETAKEIDAFVEKDPQQAALVTDVCRWLGGEYYNEKDFTGAAKYLALVTKSAGPDKVDKATWYILARSCNELSNFQDGKQASDHYLTLVTEPAERAQGFLVLSKAQLGLKDLDSATKSAEQALTLQPEGKWNADARMQIGEVEEARGNYQNAAKSYMSVAVLYEDPDVTPRALERAYQAFQKAGDEPQATKTLSELKSRFPNYQLRAAKSG
jgi:tetratricopeptide (TPR) repeat protein